MQQRSELKRLTAAAYIPPRGSLSLAYHCHLIRTRIIWFASLGEDRQV